MPSSRSWARRCSGRSPPPAGRRPGATRPLFAAVVATTLAPSQRREGIALLRAANNAGMVVGPPLGGLLAASHFDVVFVVDAATSALLLGVVLWALPAGQGAAPVVRAGGLFRTLRADRGIVLLLGTVLVVDTVYRLLYTVFPLMLRDHDAPAWVYGASVSLNCALIVFLEPVVARRLRDRPALPLIAAGYAVVGAGFLVLGAAPGVVLGGVAVVVVTAGEMLYKPTATAQAVDLAPPGMEGRYQSLYAGASISGMLLSPLLGIALYDAAPRAVWPVAAACVLGAAAAVIRVRDRAGAAAPAAVV